MPLKSRFATVLYGVLSRDGRLTYSNAGHNPPLIVGRRGVRRLEQGGVIIGAFPDATFDEETVQLNPGDVVVVFSDGVTEAMNVDGAEFGEQRLLSSIPCQWRMLTNGSIGVHFGGRARVQCRCRPERRCHSAGLALYRFMTSERRRQADSHFR